MARIIVAISDDRLREQVRRILSGSGIECRLLCRSGQEALRAVRRMEGGIVLCSAKLADMTSAELAERAGTGCWILALARPSELPFCESGSIFRVMLPVRSGELLGSIRILIQMEERQGGLSGSPAVSGGETVRRAERLLIEENGMTEAEAEQFIRRRSRDTAAPVTEVAEAIIAAFS